MAVLRIHAPVLGQQERVFELPDERPISVGRDDACDVVLLEQAASRDHARLERHGDEIHVIDCDSANGVWVGAERVVGSRVLHDGEVVRIGDTTLTLVLDPHRQQTLYRAPAEERPVVEDPAPVPPALVAPRRPAPVPVASSASAYSLGSEPTLASESGPSHLGVHEPSAPSVYSIGEAPTLAPHAGPSDRPLGSSGSVYSLGHEPAAAREPDAFGPQLPLTSSGSVYSLGHEPAAAREPDAFGPQLRSSGSAYSLGDVPMAAFRGPDLLPPAPSFDHAASSAQLQAAPPRPSFIPPAPSPPPPAHVEPLRPPAFVVPPQARSAASSWGEWAEPMPSEQRPRGRTAGPALWLGLGLLIGGIAAMVVAVAAGYEPSELVSSIRAAVDPGGAR